MKKILFEPVILFLSRRGWSLEKIRKYQKNFLVGISIFFAITVLRFDIGFNDPNVWVSISTYIPLLIVEMILFTVFTFYVYYYFQYFDDVKKQYTLSLLSNHKQIVCAYPDDIFDNRIYKIEKGTEVNNYLGGSLTTEVIHIHIRGDETYQFDDWRVFKFVGVKESRKLKLQQLKDILKT